MKTRIKKLFSEIEQRKKELLKEYENYTKEYNFEILKGKIVFPENIKNIHQKIKIPVPQFLLGAQVRHLVSIPFIYMMMIPAIILDLFLWAFQQTCFRLYRIPIVKRSDYIVYDRQHLEYLNWIEKLNCMYCSYFNGLMGYAVEVAGRTEKYWCPIKHAKKNKTWHAWQKEFADYGDADGYGQTKNNNDCFKKIKRPGK